MSLEPTMNRRIRELAIEADAWCDQNVKDDAGYNAEWEQKFAELIVAESITLLKREWYALNNAPVGETETPRDIGLRVGARDQTGHLINVIERHFGVEE